MPPSRPTLIAVALAALLLLGLALAALPTGQGPAQRLTPAETVAQAWQNAAASGTYAYRSTIDQTTYPAPMLSNAGRAPRQEHLALANFCST